jgi:tetratricopeptide (TPR) repeat protein
MSIDLSEIDKSIEQWNKHTFQEYKDWLFKQITSNQETSIFLKCHIENFLKNYKRQIGIEENFLLKKLFFIHLELKNHKEAFNILIKLIKTFGNDKKLLRMGSEEGEIDPKRGEVAIQRYKYMMINDQNDNESMKKYIMFMKLSVDLNDKQTINDYIDLWNQYLEAFMNDPDAYNELAQVYLMVNEYDKAAFCLEELLLYSPNNYKVLNKLGDIYVSKNNAEDAKIGIKFYSRSIIIQPTPRAFFGIQNCASIIIKKEKRLDDKTKKLVDISKKELTKLYADTEFKDFDVNKIFNV